MYQFIQKFKDKRYIFGYFTIHYDKNSQSEITSAIFKFQKGICVTYFSIDNNSTSKINIEKG